LNAFDYAAPTSVDEAVSLLAQGNGAVGVLAGGTDLIPQLKEGRRKPGLLLDIKKIPETTELLFDSATGLKIGAAVSCATIYGNPDVRAHYPALVDCASLIGSVQIQNRASLGGNFCNASPAGDSPPAVIALGGVCVIVGPNGQREVAAEDFFIGPGENALAQGEMLLRIEIPAPVGHSGAFSLHFIPRNEMDIAVVNAAASVVLSEDNQSIVSARICIGAVAPVPLLVPDAASALEGQAVSDDVIEKAGAAARAAAEPISDMRGTVEQRIHLAGVLTRRAIQGAVARA